MLALSLPSAPVKSTAPLSVPLFQVKVSAPEPRLIRPVVACAPESVTLSLPLPVSNAVAVLLAALSVPWLVTVLFAVPLASITTELGLASVIVPVLRRVRFAAVPLMRIRASGLSAPVALIVPLLVNAPALVARTEVLVLLLVWMLPLLVTALASTADIAAPPVAPMVIFAPEVTLPSVFARIPLPFAPVTSMV